VLDVTTTIGKSEIIFKDLFGDAKDKVKSLFGVNAGGCTNCTTKDCKNCPMSGNALGSHQNMSGQDFDKALANFNKSYSPAPR
jgi:hypothetical protein